MIGYSFLLHYQTQSKCIKYFSLSWHLDQHTNVICVILFWQCDFTQLWGNQPTKIERKALCIKIKINNFKKQYIQWVKLHILSQPFKKKNLKEKKNLQTHPKAQKKIQMSCLSIASSNLVLEVITFAHTHF